MTPSSHTGFPLRKDQGSFCQAAPKGENDHEWNNWFNFQLNNGIANFLESPDAWKHDFEEEPSPSDCEQSYLSRFLFILFMKAEGEECEFPKSDKEVTLHWARRSAEFYFDVMNNPKWQKGKGSMGWHSRLGFAWKETAPFEDLYHTIGNFALLPEWLNDRKDHLQFIHNRKGERWDAFLKYELLGMFNRQRTGEESFSFKDYIRLNCMYQYIVDCPPLPNDWKSPKFNWASQISIWRSWLEQPSTTISIASVIDGNPLAATWDDEKECEWLKPTEIHDNEQSKSLAAERIRTLIEARGRCITYVAHEELMRLLN